jgi:methylphosphotriester-DNA--protein-cysteine methyltransferase
MNRNAHPQPSPTEWQAIIARDPAMDGQLFYGVLSTGIVCRPSCPSRPARRDSVVRFQTVEAAREGGFRSCLRCRPESPECW